jgi:2,3-bisphosphoglycerate-dependent phosphoglycerate mutase
MELLLIRHALPVRRQLVEGAADPELSDEGRAQTEHLATYLSSERLDAIYASPMQRAVQTAAPVAAVQSLTVQICDDVAEFDRDSNEYIPAEEMKASNDPRYQAMIDGIWDSERETAAQFRSRIVDTVESLVAAHTAERIAVVCHGGVINAYLSNVLGLTYSRGFFYPNYTSINRVAAARGGTRSVVTINETSHLRGTGLSMGMFQGKS